MRRLTALIAIALAGALGVGVPAAQAFSPFIGSYGGYAADGGRVIFGAHVVTNVITGNYTEVHNFNWGGHVDLFSNARVEQVEGVWHFHGHSTRFQVHGHWLGHESVQGSICILNSSGSCPGGTALIHYDAMGKTGR